MTVIGISGMGRIGRLLLRRAFSTDTETVLKEGRLLGEQIKAINIIHPAETIAHLLKYDSVHGVWDAAILVKDGQLVINGHAIRLFGEREPERIPWAEAGVEVVLDATGKFNDRVGASRHLQGGAKTVILTAPGKQMDLTVVMGVNDANYDPDSHRLLSAASCTTNCLAPVLHILDESFLVKQGWMTTIHSYTNDQNHLDNPHSDLRRARACAQSIVPTTTGAGKALTDVLPHLAPHVQGISIRVPTPNVSLIDLTVETECQATVEEVKAAFKLAAAGPLSRYIGYTEEPLVSVDFTGTTRSAWIDGLSVSASGQQIKVLAWYDNEWAYSCRVLDLTQLVLERLAESSRQPSGVDSLH
ncbi:type I glyceraldehyde-3-phosphate dehydrogenase [Paenibacillus koleovorans]|uniref:type I glyceraldehyde-3-phosphate dehydrogenase n=1 Tax=Paenibacillus koleovorans TaxID=121608 RepID=UPI0035A23BD7